MEKDTAEPRSSLLWPQVLQHGLGIVYIQLVSLQGADQPAALDATFSLQAISGSFRNLNAIEKCFPYPHGRLHSLFLLLLRLKAGVGQAGEEEGSDHKRRGLRSAHRPKEGGFKYL